MSEELLKTLVMEAEKKIEEETEKAQEESWKDNVFNKNKWQNGLVDNRPQGFFVCKNKLKLDQNKKIYYDSVSLIN